MSTDRMAFRRLREPLTIRGCTIPNRIVRTAHATGYALGSVTDQLVAYHEARARGGVGLLFVEICGVHRTSPASVNLYRPDAVEGLARLAEAVHAHGSKVFVQLWHGGPNAHAPAQPTYAASSIAEPMGGRIPVAMSASLVEEVVAGFAAGARVCQEAGIDGVELHGAHGYLVCSFLSPATNHRDDEYGGSRDKRMRFAADALGAIRAAVGDEYPVGIRLSATEGIDGGLEPEETTAIAVALEAGGLVDFVDVSMGSYYAFPKLIGAMHEPIGYQLPTSTPVTAALTVPTIVTGRVVNLDDAEQLLADGVADLVSMVRATIADPDLVRKSFDGRADEVRPCLSCNQGCIGGVYGATARLGCAVNPDVGHESRPSPIEPAAAPRTVLVVGGGPAGLEAARTAALRGHQVVLCEAADELGGQLQLARRAPHRQDIAQITDWLADEVRRLGVDVRTGTVVDADDVAAIGADAVIVATGSDAPDEVQQRMRPGLHVDGLALPHVVTVAELLAGGHPRPSRALVFDDLGGIEGISAAEHLLETGAAVVLATSRPAVGDTLGPSLQRDPARARLAAHGSFTALTRKALAHVTPTCVALGEIDGGPAVEIEADLVVLATSRMSRRELHDALAAAGTDLRLAGDALTVGDVQTAIATGRRAGLAV